MGLFEVLAECALEAIVNSDADLRSKVEKAVDEITYDDAVYKRRILIDAQQKAHNSGDKKLENRIKNERRTVQSTIKSYEERKKLIKE